MNRTIIKIHFDSHVIANAIKCDELVRLVTDDLEKCYYRTDYVVKIEKGCRLMDLSLLVYRLVDKIRNNCSHVIALNDPYSNDIVYSSDSTDNEMRIVSVDYYIPLELKKEEDYL